MEDCIFCKIAHKEMPSALAYEDEDIVVFSDINPKAPLHLLIVPKRHIPTLNDAQEDDKEILGHLLLVARKVAQEKQKKGYRLQMNVGREGGQEIEHIHLHLLAQ